MPPLDALGALAGAIAARDDVIVVPTMTTVGPWHALTAGRPGVVNVTCIGFMGGAAALGLGLALARPERLVLVLDGDGSLLMQLGVLATVAGAAPANLRHIVFKNRVYQVSGSQPIPAGDRVDFAAMARAAGYRRALALDAIDALGCALPEIIAEPGPTLVELSVEEVPDPPRGGVIPASFADEAEAARRALVGAGGGAA